MPLTLEQSDFFLADVEIQFRWYLEHADLEVARCYRKAVQATMLKLQTRPEAGRLRFENDPDLKGVRCCLVVKPFGKQLLFYRIESEALVMERTIHDSRGAGSAPALEAAAGDGRLNHGNVDGEFSRALSVK